MVVGSITYSVPLSFAAGKKNEGASIFAQQCSTCHGMEGKGYAALKTPNFTDPKWQAAHTDKELEDAIENGVPGTAMVSFKGKLDKQQREAVFKYIRSLGARKKK
jgi:cytochrome c oxidase cbb3-type subunit 3